MMRLLASYVMQGRPQAVMAVSLLAILSLLFPPLSIVSAAAVALVTLRRGAWDGLIIMVLSGAACAILVLVTFGNAFSLVGFVLLIWLPSWVLSLLLRTSNSLALAFLGGLLFAGLLIVVYYIQFPDPVSEWRTMLEPFMHSLEEAQVLETSQRERLIEILVNWMTGILATGFFLQMIAAMLLARWWQAMLYNSGGFRAEFHQLRLHRGLAVATLVVLLMALTGDGQSGSLVNYAAMLLMMAFAVHGLALVHSVLDKFSAKAGWLIGIYLLLLFAMLHMVMVLAGAGLVDAWFDFRARLDPGRRTGGTG